MAGYDRALLKRIEDLMGRAQALEDAAARQCTLEALAALGEAVVRRLDIFGIEPWHALTPDVPLDAPGEMLLRLKDAKDRLIPPYPVIMTFYQNGLAAEIDTVLFLAALSQFERGAERQVSINIAALALQNGDFVRTVLERIEAMKLAPERKIIIEIHESAPHLGLNKKVLGHFRKAGVLFAIDDVGLSLADVMRLAEFDGIADFVKLDRQSVRSHPDNVNSLDHVVSLIQSLLPGAVMVAEGVKSAEHARAVHNFHPGICYVQGLYLPDRATFAAQWQALKPAVEAGERTNAIRS